jgi:heat shock protein HslJ
VKRSMVGWLVLVVLFALSVAGCRDGGSGPIDVSDLGGRTWVLASLGGDPVQEGTTVTLEFSPAEGGIAGSGGCNHYFGNFKLQDDRLTISALGMTEMYCMDPEGVMEQERSYLTALGDAETVQLVDGQLKIQYQGGATLVFDAQP